MTKQLRLQYICYLRLVTCALASICAPTIAYAGFDETQNITASDAALNDGFGFDVGISGDNIIVGSYGSAYLYDATTGAELFKLTSSEAGRDERFGTVGISGNTAIVGASGYDASNAIDTGAAYLFDVTTGNQLLKLTANDAASGDFFGRSVAINGNLTVVGSIGDDDKGMTSGSAYLFNTTTGSQLFKLTANDGATADQFGMSVALNGTTVIVGASRDQDQGIGTGSAYLFDTATGDQLFKLTADDAAEFDFFGNAVGISENTAIVGAFGDNTTRGAAYLFDITTGDQLAKLTANDAQSGDGFGESVGISGNTAIVGAWGDGEDRTLLGAAYLFDVTTGDQIAKFTASDGSAGDTFGVSVGISGSTAIIGTPGDDNAGTDSGSAYLFKEDILDINPASDGDFTFTLTTNQTARLENIITLSNTGAHETVIHITGFTITGEDSALFDLPDFSSATLTAGDDSTELVTYDLAFLGAQVGSYSATLTLITDSGNAVYGLAATVVPEPTSAALVAFGLGLGLLRRRSE